jgi:hypothetical protein
MIFGQRPIRCQRPDPDDAVEKREYWNGTAKLFSEAPKK